MFTLLLWTDAGIVPGGLQSEAGQILQVVCKFSGLQVFKVPLEIKFNPTSQGVPPCSPLFSPLTPFIAVFLYCVLKRYPPFSFGSIEIL